MADIIIIAVLIFLCIGAGAFVVRKKSKCASCCGDCSVCKGEEK